MSLYSLLLKTASNTLKLFLNYLEVDETQYISQTNLPSNPSNGLVVYHNNDLKLYNNNQWETIANTTNETFNNLTVSNNLNIFGYNLPRHASLTYKIEKVGASWFLSYFASSQLNGLYLDLSNIAIKYSAGEVIINKSLTGINHILDFNVKMVYCDSDVIQLFAHPTTQLFNSFIPPNPAPDVITIRTYVENQNLITTNMDVQAGGGTVFIFTVFISGYS